MPAEPNDSKSNLAAGFGRKHLLAGWIGLFVFLLLGIVLETLHGLKADAYLGPANATRRLMWTLAHAHGALLALVNIAFVISLPWLRLGTNRTIRLASWGLLGGLAVLPAGFFLGGCWLYGGDPGPGVFLVPLGALFLLGGVGAVVAALWRVPKEVAGADPPAKQSRMPGGGEPRAKPAKK